jgi:hypothetical protein
MTAAETLGCAFLIGRHLIGPVMAERVIVRCLHGWAMVALEPKQQASAPLTLLENSAALLKK